jgi:hypothetical protein
MIVKMGKKIILNKLNLNACKIFVYFLPYRNTPSINIDTAEVVPPSICNDVAKGEGIFNPIIDNIAPHKTAKISGFVESLCIMILNLEMIVFSDSEIEVEFSSLYNSRVVMVIINIATDVDETIKVARYSACFVGNANIINGIPKKAKLPKTVLIVKR